ncbi:hypothetical protein EH183_04285 [Streptomyces sp. CB01881]|nr:hypothetical protein C2142_04270 [Streptomyces sp. CB01881]TYC77813.1 hypothetical protein EH183_04285 [Streptomyces sp. CB01881]
MRAARHAGDGAALVALLSGQPLAGVLQQIGDALGDAVTARVPGATDLAGRCIAALGERDWEGDVELTRQLDAALGCGPVPVLRPLSVDLEELSGLLEGDPVFGGGRIDLTTGDCWPQQVDSDERAEDVEDHERWLPVWCEGSRDGYRDMELFIATVGDADFADRLEIAIAGRGAFRRFKDVLARREDELHRFGLFAEERQRGRARAWLAGNGYRPVARP